MSTKSLTYRLYTGLNSGWMPLGKTQIKVHQKNSEFPNKCILVHFAVPLKCTLYMI